MSWVLPAKISEDLRATTFLYSFLGYILLAGLIDALELL